MVADTPGTAVEAMAADDGRLVSLGEQVGRLYTDYGFPIDMSLERIDVPTEQKIVILTGSLSWLVEHKRKSGADEATLQRTRKNNETILERFIATGETGVY